MLIVLDYGAGNLASVVKALGSLGCQPAVTSDPSQAANANVLVLPGVGAFGATMEKLKDLCLDKAVRRHIEAGKPFLGICLGLQLLFDEGEEVARSASGATGRHKGLGIIPGRVRRFSPDKKVPHIGWNQIKIANSCAVLKGIPDGSWFYFVHSYYAEPKDASWTAATTEYGEEFVSAVAKDNLFACQFHPEKSQNVGLKLLRNFLTNVGL